ncbi:MAG TPA: hypothetical protein VFO76_06010 [Candidatus Kapabacteria bacterium]|nr:hypothetical protein [Candidatus Kapabacteria bacterium]
MKRFSIIIALLLTLFSASFGQQLSLNIPTGSLPSHISDWSSNPNIILLTLVPPPGGLELSNAHIVAEVINGAGTTLASTKTKFSEQPPINGVLTAPKMFRWNEILNPNAVSIDPSIQSSAVRTGLLPDGSYRLCLYLVDEKGTLIRSINSGCGSFQVLTPEPPMLVSPKMADTLKELTPTFSWLAPTPMPLASHPHFRLKIVPIYPGQSGEQAMMSADAFYSNLSVEGTTIIYPASAPSLASISTVKSFAWSVQALDASGAPIGKNNGTSAVGIFYLPKNSSVATCTCGCGGSTQPACAHKGCVCSKSKSVKRTGNNKNTIARSTASCTCGCGGTPQPACAHKGCVCANTSISTCACGCGGSTQPACAHKGCVCAGTSMSSCTCGCGGTAQPACAHKGCVCANTSMATCTCGCGGTAQPACAHKGCVCSNAAFTKKPITIAVANTLLLPALVDVEERHSQVVLIRIVSVQIHPWRRVVVAVAAQPNHRVLIKDVFVPIPQSQPVDVLAAVVRNPPVHIAAVFARKRRR